MWSLRGAYENPESGTEQASSDVAAEVSISRLAVPGNRFGLTPILAFFDRCGES